MSALPLMSGLEFRASPNGNPPDQQGGQATCSSTEWVREIVHGEPGPWLRVQRGGGLARKRALRAVVAAGDMT